MRSVPYHGNPSGSACALACYTMAAQYLLPQLDITFEKFGTIANWLPDYVVWAFPIWNWIMDNGIKITDYDVIDYEAWAKDGIEGLKKSVPQKEFNFYKNRTFNLEETGKQAASTMTHPNFTYIRKKPTWNDVVNEFNKPGICDISVDGHALNNIPGFSLHRVIIIDIDDEIVTIHDPRRLSDGAYRKVKTSDFRKNFESLGGPELARYSVE